MQKEVQGRSNYLKSSALWKYMKASMTLCSVYSMYHNIMIVIFPWFTLLSSKDILFIHFLCRRFVKRIKFVACFEEINQKCTLSAVWSTNNSVSLIHHKFCERFWEGKATSLVILLASRSSLPFTVCWAPIQVALIWLLCTHKKNTSYFQDIYRTCFFFSLLERRLKDKNMVWH